MEIPYDQIEETHDREWTAVLLDVIESSASNEDAVDDASRVLIEMADPRFSERLFAIATDIDRSVPIRQRALYIVAEAGLSPEGNALRKWWASGDELLMSEALADAGRTEADMTRPVASDPLHPLYRHAIRGLELGFEEPEWQLYKTAALSHFDPAVRATAAEVVEWDEPIIAEDALLELAYGPDTGVAIHALQTLNFYETKKTLTALAELQYHDDRERADVAQDKLRTMCDKFNSSLQTYAQRPAARDHLLSWMGNLADIVAVEHSYTAPETNNFGPEVAEPQARSAPPATELEFLLNDLSGQWAERFRILREDDWTHFGQTDRDRLRRVLLDHVDPEVRQDACAVLASWNDTGALLQLTQDRFAWVRRSAVEHLIDVPPSREVADVVWAIIESGTIADWPGLEAVDTWFHHVGSAGHDRLVDLARDDKRERLRWTAINHLQTVALGALEPILLETPLVTWDIHDIVLGAFIEAKEKPKSFGALRDVDDLNIAVSLAEFEDF